jgi:hypothetical protein
MTLRWIKEDYLTAASSVALMNTSDDVENSRQKMAQQSKLFYDETKNQILIFNGNFDEMKASINSTEQTIDSPADNFNDSVQLIKSSARLMAFVQSAKDREDLLNKMSAEGANITDPQEISDQIDAERMDMERSLPGAET